MSQRDKKIAVIGAGVIGLTTALRLQDIDHTLDVTIIADKFSPYTTSDVAGGFWEPFSVRETPVEKTTKWGKITFDYLRELSMSEIAGNLGVYPVSGYLLSDEPMPQLPYSDIFTSVARLQKHQLDNFPKDVVDGWFVTSMLVEPTPYLQMYMKKFQQNGGKFIQKKVQSFNEFAHKYDVVVNCTGLGSHHLCNDDNIQPIRGQVLKVKGPWVKHFCMIDRKLHSKNGFTCYIFPRRNEVVLGGTIVLGDWDTEVREEDTKHILKVAGEFNPALKHAEILEKRVGLRPARTSVRLEREVVKIQSDYGIPATLQVVHNYGHGGAGWSLFWGCAQEATELVLKALLQSSL